MIQVGAWQIHPDRSLGSGGYGEVWEGRHADLGVPVAIKVLPNTDATDELKAVGRLNHPGIVRLLDTGTLPDSAPKHKGCAFLVLERAWGAPLSAGTDRPWNTVITQLLDALAHAHARGVVHGDLSPNNVHITADGVRLLDFGLAALFREEPDDARQIRGSAGYMAPEQRAGEWHNIGPWTDLFAVGAIGYALLTGAPPAQLPPPACDDTLDRWFAQMLAIHPEQRPQRAADAALALPQGPQTLQPGSTPLTVTLTAEFEANTTHASSPADPMVGLAPCPATWTSDTNQAPTHALLQTLGTSSAIQQPHDVVGRVKERDALWQILTEVHHTRTSTAVVLHGPEGVGRRRLMRWLVERSHELGVATECLSTEQEAVEKLASGRRIAVVRVEDAHPKGVQLAQALNHQSATASLVMISASEPIEGLRGLAIAPLSTGEMNQLVRGLLALEPALTGLLVAHAAGLPGVAVSVLDRWRNHLRPGPLGMQPELGWQPTLPTADDDAATLLKRAGDCAIRGNYPGCLGLVHQYERALERAGAAVSDERWGRGKHLAADTLALAGRWKPAEQALHDLAELARLHQWPMAASVHRSLATLYMESGRHAQAMTQVDLARETLTQTSEPLLWAMCLQIEGGIATELGDLDTGNRLLGQASVQFGHLDRVDQQVACDGTRGIGLAFCGHALDAIAVLSAARIAAEPLGASSLLAYLSLLLCGACIEADDLDAASAHLDDADRGMSRVGNAAWWAYVSWSRASIDLFANRRDAAHEGLQELVGVFEKLDPNQRHLCQLQLAWLALRQGQTDVAEPLIREALTDADLKLQQRAWAALAWVAVQRNDPESERQAMTEMRRIQNHTGLRDRLYVALTLRDEDLR